MLPKNQFAIFVSLLFTICISVLNGNPIETRIVGGDSAEKGLLPYMVLFYNRENGKPIADGAIISSRHILTSAYGVKKFKFNPEQLIASLGAWRIGINEFPMDVAEVHLHSEFKDGNIYAYNVAVVKTVDDIDFHHLVQPVSLPIEDLISGGISVVISGFGLTHDPQLLRREIDLQYLRTVTISRDACNKQLSEKFYPPIPLIENFICTKNPIDTGISYAEFGSPMVVNNTLVGIASWNAECLPGPNVFTNVFTHLDFIKSQLN